MHTENANFQTTLSPGDDDPINISGLASVSEHLLDRFEQMEFAFAESTSAARELTSTLKERLTKSAVGNSPDPVSSSAKSDDTKLPDRAGHSFQDIAYRLSKTETAIQKLRFHFDTISEQVTSQQNTGADKFGSVGHLDNVKQANVREALEALQLNISGLAADLLSLKSCRGNCEEGLGNPNNSRSDYSGMPKDFPQKILSELKGLREFFEINSKQASTQSQVLSEIKGSLKENFEVLKSDFVAKHEFNDLKYQISERCQFPSVATSEREINIALSKDVERAEFKNKPPQIFNDFVDADDNLYLIMKVLVELKSRQEHQIESQNDFALKLVTIEEQIQSQAKSNAFASKHIKSVMNESFEALTESLKALERRFLSDFFAAPSDEVSDALADQSAAFNVLKNQLDTIFADIKGTPNKEQFERSKTEFLTANIEKFQSVLLHQTRSNNADLKNFVTVFFEKKFEDLAVSSSRLEALSQQISALRTRPDPVLDVGPQRRAFGQFSIALKEALSRIENLSQRVEARISNDSEFECDPTSIIEPITAAAAGLELRFADLETSLVEKIDHQFARLQAYEPRFEEIKTGLETLRTRPDPVLDIGPQRRCFNQFGLVLKDMLEQFQSVADRLDEGLASTNGSKQSPQHEGDLPGTITEQHTNIWESQSLALLKLVLARLDEISFSFENSTRQSQDLMPVAIAHNKSFARFHTVNEAVLKRFETLVDVFGRKFATFETGIEAKLADNNSSNTQAAVATALIEPVRELAQANRMLASEFESKHEVLASHTKLVSDLRIAISETIAQLLQSAEKQKTEA